ncbi:MAG TPA: phosphate ABC transporter substrate-binding protein [Candidatus Dormibacteraeota bacterium]|nr:phosphate ABC transporter substrate-binding protein [Candidatus Dormibacteraeota bacterium]
MNRSVLAATAIGGTLLLAACGGSSSGGSASPVSGTVTASGSTALQPLVAAAKDGFEAANPQATVQVTGGGSGTGLSQVASGAVNIGDSDIPVSQSTIIDPTALVDHQVAVVAFSIITNPSVTAKNLTKEQAHDVITGKVTNWKEVGGNDQKIQVILRPANSGTRKVFKKIVLGADTETATPASTQDATNTVLQLVSQTPGSVSYVALGSIKSSSGVTKVSFDGVEPSVANVESGKYKIWSHEHMYTKGAAAGAAKAFIDFILSSGFQNGSAFSTLGFIPTGKVTSTSPADS